MRVSLMYPRALVASMIIVFRSRLLVLHIRL